MECKSTCFLLQSAFDRVFSYIPFVFPHINCTTLKSVNCQLYINLYRMSKRVKSLSQRYPYAVAKLSSLNSNTMCTQSCVDGLENCCGLRTQNNTHSQTLPFYIDD